MKETTVRKIVFLAAQTLWMNSWETDFYNCFWFTCVCDIMEQLDDEPTIQDFCKRINDVLCDGEFLSYYTKLTGISQEQIETAFEMVENIRNQADSNDLMLTMTTQDIAELIYWENNMVIQYHNKNKETTIEQLNSMFHELNKFKVHFMLNENKIIICEI
jgi:hypothetical protein